MTLVLLVLAGIWAAVLIPPAVRARAEGRPGDSISNFRRQLTVLRRTSPHVGRSGAGDLRNRFHGPAAPVMPVHGPLRSTSTRTTPRGPQVALRAGAPASAARSRTIRRRRDVFTALLVAVVATLLLGVVLGSSLVWGAHLLTDVLLVAYVALLVHQRNVAAERDLKVRYFPQAASRLEPALLRAEPALLRRSAN